MASQPRARTNMIASKVIAERTVDALEEKSSVNDGCDFDVAHSERNILEWMGYLPPDCIQTMIRMGWDCST
jgi:hypothetical protein